MKYFIQLTFLSLSILISCQKTEQNATNNKTIIENTKQYLKIPLDSNYILIGPLESINDSAQSDYTIRKDNDTIFITKNFLESNDIDGAKISLEKKAPFKILNIKFNVGYLFNGTEKENKYLNFNYIFNSKLKSNSTIPDFVEVKQNPIVRNYLNDNKNLINNMAYKNYISYFEQIPTSVLKNCCKSDFENFQRIKNFSNQEIQLLNIEEDLGTYLDYQSLTIDVFTANKKYVLVFSKNDVDFLTNKIESKSNSQTITNIEGGYNITTEAISLYNNKKINLGYYITFKSNKKAVLSIDAQNSEDYWCEGEYDLINENDILYAKGKCDQDDLDDFFIKKENDHLYIKSKRFLNQNWQKLTKDNK